MTGSLNLEDIYIEQRVRGLTHSIRDQLNQIDPNIQFGRGSYVHRKTQIGKETRALCTLRGCCSELREKSPTNLS